MPTGARLKGDTLKLEVYLTWQNPEQLFVAQELINKVKSKCCGIKERLVNEVEYLKGAHIQ